MTTERVTECDVRMFVQKYFLMGPLSIKRQEKKWIKTAHQIAQTDDTGFFRLHDRVLSQNHLPKKVVANILLGGLGDE